LSPKSLLIKPPHFYGFNTTLRSTLAPKASVH
jgi:hypothetical protein